MRWLHKLILPNRASYILAVKESQKELFEEIIDEFESSKDIKDNTHFDIGHGRIEKAVLFPTF